MENKDRIDTMGEMTMNKYMVGLCGVLMALTAYSQDVNEVDSLRHESVSRSGMGVTVTQSRKT